MLVTLTASLFRRVQRTLSGYAPGYNACVMFSDGSVKDYGQLHLSSRLVPYDLDHDEHTSPTPQSRRIAGIVVYRRGAQLARPYSHAARSHAADSSSRAGRELVETEILDHASKLFAERGFA